MRVLKRLLCLIELTKFMQKWPKANDEDYEHIAAKYDASGRTLRRWEAAYRINGAKGLVPKKAKGAKIKPVRGHAKDLILRWRKQYNWGAQVIQVHLKMDYKIEISMHRINGLLRRKKLLKIIRKKKIKNKHTRIVNVKNPGDHTQLDVKYVTEAFKRRKTVYEYSFVDHATKWRFKRVYGSIGAFETKMFMEELIKIIPFKIKRLQTDNGSEFTNIFLSHVDEPKKHILDIFCNEHNIRHVTIPVGEKELQGLVERSHRQDDEEFLRHLKNENSVSEINEKLDEYCRWANQKRRRKSLNWKTTQEFIEYYVLDLLAEQENGLQ
ncbi:MAG: hypothetical protein AABZ92_04145 [Verrucomicrobiota bacterium]